MQSETRRTARSPRALKRAFALGIAAVLSSFVGTASAKPEFPGQLKDNQKMPCVPTCMLCHTDPAGGKSHLNEYAGTFWAAVLSPTFALTADADMDGKSDGDELKAGENPIIPGNTSVCIPEYGCGARVARTPPDGSLKSEEWVFGALGLGVLLRWQLRRRKNAVRA